MDPDAESILKLVAVTGSPALAVWVALRLMPGVTEAWKHYLEWRLKYNQQRSDLATTHHRLMVEQRVAMDAEQKRLIDDLHAEITALRTELREAREEVAAVRAEMDEWMQREHKCRDDVHALRNELHAASLEHRVAQEEKAALTAAVDKTGDLLRNLERMHPELFK